MKYGFHHIHLVTGNLEKSRCFFTEALGASDKGTKGFGGARGHKLDLGGVRIYLRELKPGEKRVANVGSPRFGYDHIGLAADDVAAACRDLEGHGAVITVPPKETPSGWVAFLTGPDDILIELYNPQPVGK